MASPVPAEHSGFIQSVIVSEAEIASKVSDLAKQISNDFKGQELTIVGILHGAFLFMADLVRQIQGVDLRVDFMSISSYGDSSVSSGAVKIIMDTKKPIVGKNVLVVEDVIDSGLTLKYLLDILSQRNLLSLNCAVLLRKTGATHVVPVKYLGWEIPREAFVVGYGLDYAGQHRCLPYVGELKPEVYTK